MRAIGVSLWHNCSFDRVVSLSDATCDGLAILQLDLGESNELSPFDRKIALRVATEALRKRLFEALEKAQKAADERGAVLGVRLLTVEADD